MILGACTTLDARQEAALPTADMSRPRDAGNNIQTYQAGATSQLAESSSLDGHSTGIETVGADPGNLRQKTAIQLLNEYRARGNNTIQYEEYICTQ